MQSTVNHFGWKCVHVIKLQTTDKTTKTMCSEYSQPFFLNGWLKMKNAHLLANTDADAHTHSHKHTHLQRDGRKLWHPARMLGGLCGLTEAFLCTAAKHDRDNKHSLGQNTHTHRLTHETMKTTHNILQHWETSGTSNSSSTYFAWYCFPCNYTK